MGFLKTKFNEFINEKIGQQKIDIEIIDNLPDEKSDNDKPTEYLVKYSTIFNEKTIEIEGILKPFNTGRDVDYEFEPSEFINKDVEEYYDNNWEDIEQQIKDKFYNI